MNNGYLKKVICVILCCNILVFSGCIPSKQNVKTADVYKTFEEDCAMLQQVTEYMLQQINEHKLHMIIIQNYNGPMTINYGKELDIKDEEIKQILKELFNRGYMRISFNKNNPNDESVIKFEHWKKPGEYEYRSGYAYSPNAKGRLNIQYIISQEELSVPGWYYYEEDYNEWRSKRQGTVLCLDG